MSMCVRERLERGVRPPPHPLRTIPSGALSRRASQGVWLQRNRPVAWVGVALPRGSARPRPSARGPGLRPTETETETETDRARNGSPRGGYPC